LDIGTLFKVYLALSSVSVSELSEATVLQNDDHVPRLR